MSAPTMPATVITQPNGIRTSRTLLGKRKVWVRSDAIQTHRFKACKECLPHPQVSECMQSDTNPNAWDDHVQIRTKLANPYKAIVLRRNRVYTLNPE